MARGGITWVYDSLRPGMAEFPVKMHAAISAAMEFEAPRIASYMKQNAPWTDRTSNARNGLDAQYASGSAPNHTIVLFHQVPYGIWLEVANAGRFAIIGPSLLIQGRKVMTTISKVLQVIH